MWWDVRRSCSQPRGIVVACGWVGKDRTPAVGLAGHDLLSTYVSGEHGVRCRQCLSDGVSVSAGVRSVDEYEVLSLASQVSI